MIALSAVHSIAKTVPPMTGGPARDRVLAGDPVWTTWQVYESPDRSTRSGIWRSTPGLWRISYDRWEFVHILSGLSVVRGDDGSEIRLAAGESYLITPGFTGTWEVVETCEKQFLVKQVQTDPTVSDNSRAAQ